MAINQEAGRAIFVQEIDTDYGALQGRASGIKVRGYSNTVLYAYDAPALVPDIEFEKLHLEYSIIVRFELK